MIPANGADTIQRMQLDYNYDLNRSVYKASQIVKLFLFQHFYLNAFKSHFTSMIL